MSEEDNVNPNHLEDAYQEYSQNLKKWAPDGIIHVDLSLLNHIGLLSIEELEHESDDAQDMFHVIETPEKIVLYNNQFAIWIVPKIIDQIPSTLTYIARLTQNQQTNLELIFSTTGVYNTPKYILKVLSYFLSEVIDTEAMISTFGKRH